MVRVAADAPVDHAPLECGIDGDSDDELIASVAREREAAAGDSMRRRRLTDGYTTPNCIRCRVLYCVLSLGPERCKK